MRTESLVRRSVLTIAVAVALLGTSSPAWAHGPELSRSYHMKRCPGTIHAGLTSSERQRASHYARYRRITCARARAVVRIVDREQDGFPPGYHWGTPHGPSSSWALIFGHTLRSFYAAPDGGRNHTAVLTW